jgi:hypothetical protein|tara:strand:- start:12656 stop:12940 length:285 start_codon:yes stop_codon:yes gene_type:complete
MATIYIVGDIPITGKREVRDPIFNEKIGLLTVDERACSDLRNNGIRTIADLVLLGKYNILPILRWKWSYRRQVQSALEGYGLRLGMRPDEIYLP